MSSSVDASPESRQKLSVVCEEEPKLEDEGAGSQKIVINVKDDGGATSHQQKGQSKVKTKVSVDSKRQSVVKREISLVLEPTPKKCSGYVGFATMPQQVFR